MQSIQIFWKYFVLVIFNFIYAFFQTETHLLKDKSALKKGNKYLSWCLPWIFHVNFERYMYINWGSIVVVLIRNMLFYYTKKYRYQTKSILLIKKRKKLCFNCYQELKCGLTTIQNTKFNIIPWNMPRKTRDNTMNWMVRYLSVDKWANCGVQNVIMDQNTATIGKMTSPPIRSAK